MRLTKRIRVVAATIALSSIAAVMLSTTPAAAEVQTAAVAVAPTHGNVCTAVPDSGPFFNFHNSCHWHDWCYDVHPYGGGYSGRLSCDNGFLSRMRSSCYDRYSHWYQVPARGICYGIANDYYVGVRAFGGSHF